MADRPALYVVAVNPRDLELSFIRPHLERLPADAVGIQGYIPAIDGRPVLSDRLWPRLGRKAARMLQGRGWDEEITRAYVHAFDRRPAAVLAEFGPTAVRLVEPCRRAGLPLIAHFHGYDTSVRSVLDEHHRGYQAVFRDAAAIIAVSRSMRTTLIAMGAPEARVHYCPYGVDCNVFHPGDPAAAPPTILAVGRFVDKKAPHLTILAFADVLERNPRARLRMIGDGPLFGSCADLVSALRIEHAVTLLGHQPRDVIAAEMRQARCFAQHSVQAWNGDCEGTPNTVLEAGASGLAVVSTRHAGIPDVVIEGETGYLVEERDVPGMARAMARVLDDGELAQRIGLAARHHIATAFPIERRVAQLWEIIEAAMSGTPPPDATIASPAPLPAAGLTRH